MAKEHDVIEFHWADYVVFACSLAVSLGIGFYFALAGWKKQNTQDYLLGGNNMNPVAVGLSMCASLLNAVFLIGKLVFYLRHDVTSLITY